MDEITTSSPAFAKPLVVGSLSFKEELQLNIIPAIDKMIGKEREHLKWLESQRKKVFIAEAFIIKSKAVLSHLEERLIDYIQYAKKL